MLTKCFLEGHDLKYIVGEKLTYSKDIKITRYGIPCDIQYMSTKCSRCGKKIILNFKRYDKE